MSNTLYYGDNLVVLGDREHFPDSSIDLIYDVDPDRETVGAVF